MFTAACVEVAMEFFVEDNSSLAVMETGFEELTSPATEVSIEQFFKDILSRAVNTNTNRKCLALARDVLRLVGASLAWPH